MIVARWWTVVQAELACTAVHAAGIDAWVADEHIVGLNWLDANAVGLVKVLVREEDVEDATDVLTVPAIEIAGPDAPDEVNDLDDVLSCPACGSEDVARVSKLPGFLAIAVIVIGMSVVTRQPLVGATAVLATALVFLFLPSTRCGSCGERWSPVADAPEPLPTAGDLEETHCPRCGFDTFYRVRSPQRQLQAISLFITGFVFALLLLWPLLPKRKCDHCGHRGF